MAGELVSRLSSLGSSPGQVHCIVVLDKTLDSQSGFLHMAINGYQFNPAMD